MYVCKYNIFKYDGYFFWVYSFIRWKPLWTSRFEAACPSSHRQSPSLTLPRSALFARYDELAMAHTYIHIYTYVHTYAHTYRHNSTWFILFLLFQFHWYVCIMCVCSHVGFWWALPWPSASHLCRQGCERLDQRPYQRGVVRLLHRVLWRNPPAEHPAGSSIMMW